MDKGITIYCASSDRVAPVFMEAARELGREIAKTGLPLINGAGKMGLMGAANDAAIEAGGTTIGVIPQFMVERGWNHTGLTRLEVTPCMHTRKETMARLSRGAIALPGGFGTFDELFEIITWKQLGLYDGNIVIYNVDGYYDSLLAMIGQAVEKQFIPADHSKKLFTVATTAQEAVKNALATNPQQEITSKY